MDRGLFTAAMRMVATPVSIVSTDGPVGRHGATVSAVCSVSADPPSLLVCLNADSTCARIVEENGAFCVNVIFEGQTKLARAFAGQPEFVRCRAFDSDDWVDGYMGLPTLIGASAAFFCLVEKCYVQGSHKIIVGKVVHAEWTGNAPATYLNGSYRKVSELAIP